MVVNEFGLEPLSGHLLVFLNRRGHLAQMALLGPQRLCILKKRLEAGTFSLSRGREGTATHVEVDSAELALMLEGIELKGATRRKRLSSGRKPSEY